MFQGCFTALVTPFKEGKVDEDALKRLLEIQIEAGVAGVVPCGTTGESATLSYEEHNRVIELTKELTEGKIKVIAGTGSNSTAETIMLTRHAEEVGADAALLITPYYNKPTQKGLLEHYGKIAEHTSIPLILYNVPSRTGVNMLPETVARLSEFENIVGIKEASGDLDQVSQIIELTGEDFTVLSGDDSLTLPMLAIGGRGVISVTSNILPSEVSLLCKHFFDGNLEEARKLHQRLQPLNRIMFIETNPIPVKTALSMMGLIEEELRLPLTTITDANRIKLEELLKNYGLIKEA
ncbi:MAG TPA: 4-hydroxy-tetrahydrodipicolinate synthase [Deltaproteobacteria bacterium]|nr:4-hydroxy-tetrahydrodipicolinate synthase [Deltaproteobacteria bacterium]